MTSPPDLWVVVEEGARAGTSLRLEGRPVLVGRDTEAALRMDPHEDRLVSTRHALLGPTGDGWTVKDLDSRNGTFVNGNPLEGTRTLRPGDRIQLGRTGPVILFTDRPADAVVRHPGEAPPTRSVRTPSRRTTPLLVGGLAVAGAAAALTFWLGDGSRSAGAADLTQGTPPADSTAGAPAGTPTIGPAPGAAPVPDSTAARQAREIAALRDEIESLRREIRRSEAESDRLRTALSEAQRSGVSSDSIRVLERRLNSANASLRRQQLAASLDFEAIGRAIRPATTQIYVEYQGNHVVVATAFGIDTEGLLLTNRHVVQDDGGRAVLNIGIRYPGHQGVVPAEVVAVSPTSDLALVRLVRPRSSYPRVPGFNESADTLAEGSPLAISGFPLGGSADQGAGGPQPLLSTGVLMGRSGDYLEIEGYGRSGASGSPIVDADGQVVGVLIGGTREGGERVYALPASRVLSFLRSVSATR